MTMNTTTIPESFKTERDLLLINILSALLIAVIAFSPDSPARIILGLPFILFFSGYVLICALFPRRKDLDIIERLALSLGLSIAVTSLMGLVLNYTPFGIRLYPVTFSLFLFIVLLSIVAMYRRRTLSLRDAFAPLASISMSGWFERVKSEFMKLSSKNRILKSFAIMCFILITIALVVARNSPATGYEASIYNSTPPILWFSLILSIVCGITIIVHQIYNREYEKHNLWMIGLLLVFLSYTICLSLYIIRGYYMWCMTGDPATHLGSIKQISTDGHIANSLFYPIAHIYTTELSQMLNIDLISLHKLIPLFFGLLFIVFMYILAKSILPGKGQVILATVAGCSLAQGWYLNLTPNHLSNLLFPMLLFILVKVFTTRKLQWEILLLIMVFLYPPFHPVPTLALMITLIALWLPKRAFALINKDTSQTNNEGRFNATLLLILCVWAITWISSFFVWNSTIRNIHTLMVEGGPSHLSKLTEKITYAEGYGYSVIEQIFKVEGGIFVYIILTLICLPILWKEMHTNREINNLFSLYGPLSVIALFIIMLYFFNVGFGPLRVLVYVVVMCTIFTGFILYKIIEKIRQINKASLHKFALALVIILLVGVSIHGMLKLYPSPYLVSSSYQTTQTEVEGMNWLFHSRNLDIKITGISIAPGRFANLLLTPEEKRAQRLPGYWYLTEEAKAPFHFGYDNHSSLSASYNEDVYLGLTQRDKSIYADVLPEMAELRWYPSDFEKLEHDRGVDKLYSSGGFDVWYVHTLG